MAILTPLALRWQDRAMNKSWIVALLSSSYCSKDYSQGSLNNRLQTHMTRAPQSCLLSRPISCVDGHWCLPVPFRAFPLCLYTVSTSYRQLPQWIRISPDVYYTTAEMGTWHKTKKHESQQVRKQSEVPWRDACRIAGSFPGSHPNHT